MRVLLYVFLACSLTACGGGGSGPSDYYQGVIINSGGVVLQTCDPTFSTASACDAAAAACKSAYKFPPIPINAYYTCSHHTSR